ncbi:MAG: Tim44-like domain-containing protein [Burkholderiaceae bacterium]
MLSLAVPRMGRGGLRAGAVSLGVLLACASADARTAGLAGASTSLALVAILASMVAVPGWPLAQTGAVWGYPVVALVAACGWIGWRVLTRSWAPALPRWNRTDLHRAARPTTSLPAAAWDAQSVLAVVRPHFVTLQAAWDAGDLVTLRGLTTPAMYDEIAGQLGQRGPAPNRTDVLTVGAELLRIEQVGALWLASVQYSGMLRESSDDGAVAFREVWLLACAPDEPESGWRLARQHTLW